MKSTLLKSIIESGVNPSASPAQKRSITFSNCIALILIGINVLLFLVIPQNRNLTGLFEATIGISVLSVSIVLNRLHFTRLGLIYLSWLPPILVTWIIVLGMKEATLVPTSSYVGLRIYLLATSCVPYLILDRRNIVVFTIGILPNLLILVFCDRLLDFFEVGHSLKGAVDAGYALTLTRSLIAYFVIGACCLSLRYVTDNTDDKNHRLIDELKRKNLLIKNQADSELTQLNHILRNNLEKLTKRETALQRSQEIAKVGSWEYYLHNNSFYWSDQMYDIFAVDKSFDINGSTVTKLLLHESSELIDDAFSNLLAEGKSYDFTLKTKIPLGYTKWLRISGYPLLSEGHIIGASGIVHDVTIFKESEERFKANERNYRSLFEQATDAISIMDFKGNFIDVNSSMCSLLGYTKEELLTMKSTDIISSESLKNTPPRFDKLSSGEHIVNERTVIRKDGSEILMEANSKMFDESKIMTIARDITERKTLELEKDRARHFLNERIKELTTLYKVGQILQVENKPVHEVLQEIVDILPAGWQYPSITAAKIIVAEMEFVSSNYREYKHEQLTEFTTRNQLKGMVQIVYLENQPDEVEGPFLAEERNLLNMISDQIQIFLSRRYEEMALKQAEANQRATINNTNFLVWSINRDFEIISCNQPFCKAFKTRYNYEIKLGSRILGNSDEFVALREQWQPRYRQALEGEAFKVKAEFDNRLFEFSLNPIIEEEAIIGVSIFGEDISERVEHEQQMLAVNKQLGELRLMALRSVMNPHFIFNCLNSIQYYIMDNDKKNAVTYLSTFSKLIRSILNNSVNSRVKLVDELEMLKHYIQLESIRFENKFDWRIELDPDIDVEGVEVPSMLIQPYVENAILHGLYNKKEKGLLTISISLEEGMILVVIEDNGVGREAAATIKQLNLPKHKSMGTALTEERLKLINEAGDTSIEIHDLETDGKPSGTQIKVWIKE